jgi:hypothetical protein
MYSIPEKRMMETFLPGVVSSYSEMQERKTVYLIIHYRFNKAKTKENQRNQSQDSEGLSRIKIRTQRTGPFFLDIKKRTLN